MESDLTAIVKGSPASAVPRRPARLWDRPLPEGSGPVCEVRLRSRRSARSARSVDDDRPGRGGVRRGDRPERHEVHSTPRRAVQPHPRQGCRLRAVPRIP